MINIPGIMVMSADNLWKKFGPRSGSTNKIIWHSDDGSQKKFLFWSSIWFLITVYDIAQYF